MLDNLGFDFSGADTITRGLDDVVVAPLKIDVALIVEVAHVTS